MTTPPSQCQKQPGHMGWPACPEHGAEMRERFRQAGRPRENTPLNLCDKDPTYQLLVENQRLRDRLALADPPHEACAAQVESLQRQLALAEQALVDAGLREDRLRAVVDAAQEWALVRFDGKPYHPNTDDFAAEAKLATAVARLKDFLAARLDETAPK